MPDTSFLDWPFLDQRHREWAAEVEAWATAQAERLSDEHDADGSVINLARAMGEAGRARMDALGISWEHVTRRLLA